MAVDMLFKIDDVKAQDAKPFNKIDVFSWPCGMPNSGSAHFPGGASSAFRSIL